MHNYGMQDTYTPAHTAHFEGIQRLNLPVHTESIRALGLLNFIVLEG